MKKISVTLCAFLLIFCLTSAASALTLSSVDGTWGAVTGGAPFNYNYDVDISYGNSDEDQVLWGTSTGGQSGLGFTGIATPSLRFKVGDTFEIGQLRYLNNPSNATSAVDLSISLSFSNPLLAAFYLFDFSINESPDNTGDNDFIYFPTSYASQTYEYRGIGYTLQFLGFGKSESALESQFETPEYVISTTNLYGRITTAPVPTPEPATILLLGFGIAGLVGFGRKKFFNN